MLAGEVALESRDTQLCRAGPREKKKKKKKRSCSRGSSRPWELNDTGLIQKSQSGAGSPWVVLPCTAASHMVKGTFHEHERAFLSEAL